MNISQRVLIFCDADVTQGVGHLMRSLVVAAEAQRAGFETVVVGELSPQASRLAALIASETKLIQLPPESGLADRQLVLDQLQPDVVHIDSYSRLFDSLEAPNSLISNMQDGPFGAREADLQIDANLNAEYRTAHLSLDTPSLLSTSAMLIREQVKRQSHAVNRTSTNCLKLLVVLGGTDPNHVTPRVARALAESGQQLNVTIVCRESMHQEITDLLAPSHVPFQLLSFVDDLPELANEHDLVITAAGTSVWDFASAGIPMALLCTAENQVDGYRACIAAGLGSPLGEPPHEDLVQRVRDALVLASDPQYLISRSDQGRVLIDGLGSWRLVESWQQLLRFPARIPTAGAAVELHPRAATLDDARLLLDWRNDPSTRSVSRVSDEVDWTGHLTWLAGVIKSPTRELLVIEREGEPVGTARWDMIAANTWEASITVSPNFRGQKLAAPILNAAEHALTAQNPVQLIATIHEENSPSRRLFGRAGYLPHTPTDEHGFGRYAKWRLGN